VNLNKLRVLKVASGRVYSARKGDGAVVLACDTVPLSEDVLVRVGDRDGITSEQMLSFRINLRFLDDFHAPETVSARARTWSRGASDGPGGAPAATALTPTLSSGAGASSPPVPTMGSGTLQPHRRAIRALLLPFRRIGSKPTGAVTPPTGGGGGGHLVAGATTAGDRSEWIEVQPAAVERKGAVTRTASSATEGGADEDDDVPVGAERAPDDDEEDGIDSDMEDDLERPRPRADDELTKIQAQDDGPAAATSSGAGGLEGGVATATANPVVVPTIVESTQALDELTLRATTATPLDAYVAKRVRVTLTKAELDLDRPDRFPDDFAVTLYFREPRLRRFTREDIEATVAAERRIPGAVAGLGSGDDRLSAESHTVTHLPLEQRTSGGSNDTLTNLRPPGGAV
jgi:hypothetical protein